ncbi:MAG TPA: hypothetical protein VJ550_13285 [Geomonas sp.]|nr:hypothetical protein [Geomonas sp.]
MGSEEHKELNDITLCYQAMGLALDASPETVDRRYRALCDEYRKKSASPDVSVREEAKVSLELLNEMYQNIRNSITFLAAERESEKRRQAAGVQAPVKRVHSAVAERGVMMACPRCNGSIVIGSKVCPICKVEILTTAEKIAAHFTMKRVIIYLVILAVLVLAALRMLAPNLFTDSKPEAVDIFEKGSK